MRPHLGKMRTLWAICTKSGQKCSRIIGQKKYNHHYNSLVRTIRWQSSRLTQSPKSSSLPQAVTWQSLPKAIQGLYRSFDYKINGWALGAVLLHSFGLFDWQLGKQCHEQFASHTQGVFKSTAVPEASTNSFKKLSTFTPQKGLRFMNIGMWRIMWGV